MEVWKNPEETAQEQTDDVTDIEDLPEGLKETLMLMQFALAGKHTEVELLRNRQELAVAKVLRKANRKAAAGFRSACRETLKEYVANLRDEVDDLSLLLDYRAMLQCAEFYEQEAKIMEDLMQEYSRYVFSGHILDTYVFGRERSDDDMYDYRKGK